MEQNRQSIFKMVHLRGVKKDGIEEPKDPEDDGQGPVIELLAAPDSINPFEIDDNEISLLRKSIRNLSFDKLSNASDAILNLIEKDKNISVSKLCEQSIEFDGTSVHLGELASSLIFQKEFSNLYNIWVLDKLSAGKKKKNDKKTKYLQVANLVSQINKCKENKIESINLSEFLNKPVLLPKSVVRKGRSILPSDNKSDEIKSNGFNLKESQENYEKLISDLKTLQAVEKKVLKKWSSEVEKENVNKKTTVALNTGRKGIINKTIAWLFGSSSKTVEVPIVKQKQIIDKSFLSQIKQESSAEESLVVVKLIEQDPKSISEVLKTTKAIRSNISIAAQDLYSKNVYYANPPNYIPPTSHHPKPKLKYAIRALGWGDLIVATERLLDYSAIEIAHIENVLPGELKNRKHTKSKRIESFLETEEVEESEIENSLETTNRYELQKESEEAIKTDFSVSAGVNTSGRYGLTKVETSLDADFSRSVTESRRDSLNIAKEIVNKAVERTLKKTRELRRRNIITEVTDINDHTLDNVSKAGSSNSPQAISGIYRWVEKIQEIQLRHYGKRLMLEFHVPEPAISLTSTKPQHLEGIEPIVVFDTPIEEITETTYLHFAKQYGAVGIEPPPEENIHVGYAWNSTPDEKADDGKSEDTISETIAITSGYDVFYAAVVIQTLPIAADKFYAQCAIGGQNVPLESSDDFAYYNGGIQIYGAWPNGLPVTAVTHGHFDKTMAINVWVLCERTESLFTQWQIDTHEKITEAYQARLLEYQEAVAQAEFQNLEVNITARPEAINRRTEQEELKKWSIKILRNDLIDFNGIAQYPIEVNEVDPNAADINALPIQFYEEAFEWEQMSYFFYPYFWGNRDTNEIRKSFTDTDPRFEAFLRSGAARVIVPVTPGYEKRIIMYINADNLLSETEKIMLGADIEDDITPEEIENSEYNSLWAELLKDRKSGLVQGSGTLKVTENDSKVEINADSNWQIEKIDLNREVFIRGDSYEIISINTAQNTFDLNEPYKGTSDDEAIFVTGSVPFGPSWTVNLPTNLVVLDENKAKISIV